MNVTPNDWRRVREVFTAAVILPPADRGSYLAAVCAGDAALRQAVEELLSAHARAGAFMERSPLQIEPTAAIPAHSEGDRIGPYQLRSWIGAGGMGEVYLAHDSRLGRLVALKLLPAGVMRGPADVRRFHQEARAASALNHPNILTVYETGEIQGLHFIAAEYVEGDTLRARIVRGRMATSDVLDVAIQVAHALAAAHQAGVVHRDVKPENIMVRPDGYAKVLDFGIAKWVGAGEESPAQAIAEGTDVIRTQPGLVLGSPRYMSPEQVRGQPVDLRSDIFSFGAVLYEMIAGSAPFAGASVGEVSAAILQTEPLPLDWHLLGIPPQLQGIVTRALAKDREQRFQTMTDLAAALKSTRRELEFQAGFAVPVSTQQRASRARAPATGIRTIVGREAERRHLRDSLMAAAGGRGLLLCVSGDAGIGKTTVVEESLAEWLNDEQPPRIARGRCSERLSGTEAYLPFLEAFESLLSGDDETTTAALIKAIAPTWYVQIAPMSTDSGAALVDDVRTASQERMKREIVNFFTALSLQHPLVLFLDDLHWADTSTIDLLAYLGTKLDAMKLLIIATYRTSDLLLSKHPFLQVKLDLQARSVCHDLPLEFLGRDDVERYLSLTFPQHRFPSDFAALLHKTTAGSPLFIVDLVRDLRNRQVISQPHGVFTLSQSTTDIAGQLPESIRSLIERKIERVSADDHRLLVAASVQGYECDSAVLAKALNTSAADVEDRLELLDRVHTFLRVTGEHTFPDGTPTLRCRFVHVLYQNVLYASLKPARRAQLSKAIAEALVALYGERSSDVASELAHLFDAARESDRAVDFYLLAAQHASDVFAYEEATTLARRGLELLTALPITPERVQKELVLQLVAGYSLSISKGTATPEMGASMTRASEICEQIGDIPQLFPVIWGLWAYYLVGAELPKARAMAEKALRLADAVRQPELLVGAHYAMGTTLRFLGEYRDGHRHHLQAQTIDTGEHDRVYSRLYKLNPRAYSQAETVHTLWALGYADQAQRLLDKTLLQAQADHDPRSLAITYFMAAVFHQVCGDARRTLEVADACIAHCNERGIAQERDWISIWRGWAIAEQGHVQEGVAQMRESLETIRARRADVVVALCVTPLADILIRHGQVDEARAVIDAVLPLVDRTGERSHEAELYRLRGEILGAEDCFHKAIATARQQGTKAFELRSAIRLCRLYQQQGRRSDAWQILSGIHGSFTEGFDTEDMRSAQQLLAALR